MTRIIGIDPGITGAFVRYDSAGGGTIIDVNDMPKLRVTVGAGVRAVLDFDSMSEMVYKLIRSWEPELIVMEKPGGMTGQSASAAFTFGYVCGQIFAAVKIHAKCRVHTVAPVTWKKAMKVKTSVDDVLARCNELFPGAGASYWRGPRGRIMHDRCEAALLAYYGAHHVK